MTIYVAPLTLFTLKINAITFLFDNLSYQTSFPNLFFNHDNKLSDISENKQSK